jgi:hypothetical protein
MMGCSEPRARTRIVSATLALAVGVGAGVGAFATPGAVGAAQAETNVAETLRVIMTTNPRER